jgi:hypothetical protein
MATHPSGITVEIVGIEASNNGRSCEEHDVCGSILIEDVVVRLRKVQVVNEKGKEETAIAANWVSDGIDRCRVGFLQRHLIKHSKHFDGVLAQITEIYSAACESPMKRKKYRHSKGCCIAAIISVLPESSSAGMTHKRQKRNEDDPDEPANNDELDSNAKDKDEGNNEVNDIDKQD